MLLLSEVRKKLLLFWLCFAAILFLLFLIQVQNGKYTGMESMAWGWIFAQLLPGLVLLLAATLFRFNQGKVVLNWVFWAICGLSVLFLLFVFFTLLGISRGAAGLSMEAGFLHSYRYLLPLQVLLLSVFGVLFFKKETLFQPNEAVLREHAQGLMDQAQKTGSTDRQRALELFISADMQALLDFLEEKIQTADRPDTTLLNDVFLLKNNLVTLRKDTDMGRLSTEESRREYQRICVAVLGLVEEV